MFGEERYGWSNNLVNLKMVKVGKNESLLFGPIEGKVEEERCMSLRMGIDLGMVVVSVWLFHAGNYIQLY